MAAYSMDFRAGVAQACDRGMPVAAVAARYEVSVTWVYRLLQRRRATESLRPRPQTTFRGGALSHDEERRLVFLITVQPDATLAELQRALPTRAALSTLWRTIGRLGLTVKKKVHADEQRRPDRAAARRRWQETQPVHDARGYVFIDESGVMTDLLRRYGRSPRGAGLRPLRPLADPHGGGRPPRRRAHGHRRV